jgi:glycosyltransferase involved in cell wall biosynthesis
MKLSIIVRALNGRQTIRDTVNAVRAAPLDGLEREVVVVDDGPTDGTHDALSDLDGSDGLRVVRPLAGSTPVPAIARGFAEATGDLLVMHDAGLAYDPREYHMLLRPILAGRADVVFGSRFLGTPAGRPVLHFRQSLANKGLTLLSNAVTDLNLTDVLTGFKAMTNQVAHRLDLQSSGAGVEPEIACKVSRLGVRVYEVPVTYYGGVRNAERKVGVADSIRAVWTLARYATWEAPRDDVGARTLRRMSRLHEYNRWLHDRFEHYLGPRILEVGAGVGNQSQYFIDRERVIASDVEPHYVTELTTKFGRLAGVRIASFRFPLGDDEREDLRREAIDTVVCLNVLEHIGDDRATLEDFRTILPKGGHLVLLVPALPALYGTLDVHLHHFRRYEREALGQLLSDTGFEPDTFRYVNRLAVPGWWLNSRVLRRTVLPRVQLGLFRLMMPLLKSEETQQPSFGLSLLALARRR